MALNEYHHSYSYDGKDWLPVHWAKGYRKSPSRDTMRFPVFKRDRVLVGHQVPMSYEDMLALIEGWRGSPYVTTHVLGKSLGGEAPFGYMWEDKALKPDPEEEGK